MAKLTPEGYTRLSKQEKRVLSLLIQEYKNSEVAKEMNIDEKTVSTYKRRILQKTSSKTIIGLYIFNQKHKIVQLPETK